MNQTVRINANLQWLTRQSASSSRWIGVCEPLNVATEADSLDELHSVIGETVGLLFRDLLADDELDQFLREHGWGSSPMPPPAQANEVTFDVPWEMVTKGAAVDPERRPH